MAGLYIHCLDGNQPVFLILSTSILGSIKCLFFVVFYGQKIMQILLKLIAVIFVYKQVEKN